MDDIDKIIEDIMKVIALFNKEDRSYINLKIVIEEYLKLKNKKDDSRKYLKRLGKMYGKK